MIVAFTNIDRLVPLITKSREIFYAVAKQVISELKNSIFNDLEDIFYPSILVFGSHPGGVLLIRT